MGVVNVTPDSFSDGGFYYDQEKAVARALELVSAGADIIDIGGESTRPSAEPVSAEEEKERILPVISALREKTDVLISIDTTKANVAEAAVEAGADILNDISSLRFDPGMLPLVARTEVGLVLMHMQGTPQTMQLNPQYEDVVAEVKSFLAERMETAVAGGIKRERIILDPGIGFGKNLEHNLALLHNLRAIVDLGRPILVGVSRKSFLGQILNKGPLERLEGTIAAAVLSLASGASLLRVHDLEAVKKSVTVAEKILKGERILYVH